MQNTSSTEVIYNDDLKIKEALELYFSKYHFTNGGYEDKWFRIKLGPVFIPFPNIKSRVDAVKIHDIHHVLTEYPAVLKGEAEIGAWEIASGCGNYYMAWLLNFGSFFYGMLFFPKSILRSFLRGRACSTSLYYNTDYNELLLNQTVGELREHVGLYSSQKNRMTDYFYFLFYCMLVLAPALFFVWLLCSLF